MYKHILIATDGSELASKGLEHGLALAGPLGAKVTVLAVSEPIDSRVAHAATLAGVHDVVLRYDEAIATEMQEKFDAAREQAKAHGIDVEIKDLELASEVDHSPADAILRHATLNNCDLIVMASHGRRGIRRVILGSQTMQVVTHGNIPVLVIR